MNFIEFLKLNFTAKKSGVLLAGLLMFSTALVEADSLPTQIGDPIRITPVPGPANPDPILQNLVAVMDNHYQTPYYPGGFPDFLSQITLYSNFYTVAFLNFNPCNDKIMHISIGQNLVRDATGTYLLTIGTNTFATSHNRGKTWHYGPPIEQIIPLGGNISQIINSSIGPGLFPIYGKDGQLYAAGEGFWDMVPNPPNTEIEAGFLFTTSTDDGKHWSTPDIELASTRDYWYPQSLQGVGPREFYTTPDSSDADLIHASSMFPLYPLQLYGNLFYTQSKNRGKSFAPLKQVYSMIDDPVWRAANLTATPPDPAFFVYGGLSLSSGFPTNITENILMLPVLRLKDILFPLIGDQAAVRSLDNGKTWLPVAGATEEYTVSSFQYDPGFANPGAGEVVNGELVFPFIFDTAGQWASPLVSPSTGRVYFTYEAVNLPISDFNTFALVTHILLSRSDDQGATFSPSIQINRTPTTILPGAQQAFSHGAAITADGYLCVAYYDFRNWTGTPGEDIANTPLQTDAWLDVYRETEDPNGGSTGIGLDYVGEIRLTDESFNSRIALLSTDYHEAYITGTGEGIPITVNNNNELFVVYTIQSGEGVSPSNITTGYKGMTIDTNSYVTGYLKRFKFPNVSTD